MPITFDGPNKVITLESGISELEVADIYSAWKEWLLSNATNSRHVPAFRVVGGDPLSSIINAGAYFFLRNDSGWRIKPPEEDITIYLTGNLAAEDSTLPAFAPTDGGYTAAILGLQPVTQGITPVMADQLAYSSFADHVWINEIEGFAGTGIAPSGGPIGTSKEPSNNWADTVTISAQRGFYQFHVTGMTNLNADAVLTNKRINGEGPTRSIVVVLDAAQVDGLQIFECFVTGVFDGDVTCERCYIRDVDYLNGLLMNCVISPSAVSADTPTITLGGGVDATMVDCTAGLPNAYGAAPVIDLGGSGQSLACREWNGHIKFVNKNGADDILIIEMDSGICELDSTITAGDIYVRGNGQLIDNTTGSANVIRQLLDSDRVDELYAINALDRNIPIVKSKDLDRVTAGSITLQKTEDSDNVTVTRQ